MGDSLGFISPKFDWAAANPASWKKFDAHVRMMVKGPLKGKGGDVHVAYLLIWLGDTGRDIHSTWTLTDAEEDDLDAPLARFKAHIEPQETRLWPATSSTSDRNRQVNRWSNS